MPKYHDIYYRDYVIKVKPRGFRRYVPFLPYLSGNKVRFNIIAKTRRRDERKFEYKLRLYQYDGQKENAITDWAIRPCSEDPVEEKQESFNMVLTIYGQYYLKMQLDDKSDKQYNTGSNVIAEFSVLERDKVVPYIAFSLISAIFGSLLTLVILWLT